MEGKPAASTLLNDKTAIYLNIDGKDINLIKFNLDTLEEVENPLPSIKADNPIMFIALNPKDQSVLTIVTYKNG
jgi:hypothetical protein